MYSRSKASLSEGGVLSLPKDNSRPPFRAAGSHVFNGYYFRFLISSASFWLNSSTV